VLSKSIANSMSPKKVSVLISSIVLTLFNSQKYCIQFDIYTIDKYIIYTF